MNGQFASLEEFFDFINRKNYVTIRNWNRVPKVENDINEAEDIDLLCGSKDDLVGALGAFPVHNYDTNYNFYILIGEKKLRLDIREVGDGYYCSKWEQKMLEDRQLLNGIYVSNEVDYLYSLLYHALLQKRKIKDNYLSIFKEHFACTDINGLIKLLSGYLIKNKYSVEKPKDKNVYQNRSNIFRLKLILLYRKVLHR